MIYHLEQSHVENSQTSAKKEEAYRVVTMSCDQGEQCRIDAVDPFVRSKVMQARDNTIYQPSQSEVAAKAGLKAHDPYVLTFHFSTYNKDP